MLRSMSRFASLFAISLSLTACSASDAKGSASPVPTGNAADAFTGLISHGDVGVAFNGSVMYAQLVEFSEATRSHQWFMQIAAPLDVRVRTYETGPDYTAVDTRIFIYRARDSGAFGTAAEFEHSNDDESMDSRFSEIEARLEPGNYMIIVSGYNDEARGRFGFSIDAAGADGGGELDAGTEEDSGIDSSWMTGSVWTSRGDVCFDLASRESSMAPCDGDMIFTGTTVASLRSPGTPYCPLGVRGSVAEVPDDHSMCVWTDVGTLEAGASFIVRDQSETHHHRLWVISADGPAVTFML